MSLLLVLLAMWQRLIVVSTEHACELAVSSPSHVAKTGCLSTPVTLLLVLLAR